MVDMSKATFVLVPGAWHGPGIYLAVIEKLNEHRYPTIALALPSNGAFTSHQTFDEDVRAIRDTLTKLVDIEEKEVVLVLHSYAGVPGIEVMKDLCKKERYAKRLEGSVARLVFIAAFKMFEGTAPADEGIKMPEWMKFDFEVCPILNLPTSCALLSAAFSKLTNTTPIIAELLTLILSFSRKRIVTVNREDARKIFYNNLSPGEQDKWASELTHQSLGVYSSKPTYTAWLHIRSTYVGGDQDKTLYVPGIADRIDETLQRIETITVDRIEFATELGIAS